MRPLNSCLIVGIASCFFVLCNAETRDNIASASTKAEAADKQRDDQLYDLKSQLNDSHTRLSNQIRDVLSQVKNLRKFLAKKKYAGGSAKRRPIDVANTEGLVAHIRSQSIAVKMNRFRNAQIALKRDIYRELIMRIRLRRIRQHSQVLRQRLHRLAHRKAVASKQLQAALRSREKLTRMQSMLLASKASAKIKAARLRIAMQLADCILWIRSLQIRRAALRHRIRRLARRRRILQKRVLVLTKRRRRQRRDAAMRYRSLAQSVHRWRSFNLHYIVKFASNDSSFSTTSNSLINNRLDAKKFVAKFDKLFTTFCSLTRDFLVSREKSQRIKSILRASINETSFDANHQKQLEAKLAKELRLQKRLCKSLHILPVRYLSMLFEQRLDDYAHLLQYIPKERKGEEGLAGRISRRRKRLKLLLRYEGRRLEHMRRRKSSIRARRVRLHLRLVRLRARRRFERRIDAMEVQRRRMMRSVGKIGRKFGEAKKHPDVPPATAAAKHGIAVIAARIASLRRRRGRLSRRIRSTSAKRLRLAQRAVGIRCRIRQQKKRLRRLDARNRRFLRRMRQKGLIAQRKSISKWR